MRNFKKILMVICVFAFLTVGCVLLAYASGDGNTGTVAKLNELIAAAEAETEATAKHMAVVAVGEYFGTYTIDPTEEGYDDAVAKVNELLIGGADAHLELIGGDDVTALAAYDAITKANDLIKLVVDQNSISDLKAEFDSALVKTVGILVGALDADIENTLATASNQVAINRVNRVLLECSLYGEEDLLAEYKTQFAELSEAHDRAIAENYTKLDNGNLISDYELPIFFKEDWEACSVGMTGNTLGNNKWQIDLKGTKNQAGIEVDENGNRYYVHRYLDKDNIQASYVQIAFNQHNVSVEEGLVFEFDIATFGEMPGAGIQIEPGGYNMPDGSRVFPANYFFADGQGNIRVKSKDGEVLLSNAFVKGEWLHVIIVFEPNEFVYKLYVAGEYVGEFDAKYDGQTYDHTMLCFRLSGAKTSYGEIAYDNISIYSGTSYRQHGKFDSMTDDEKFIYYVNYLEDESKVLASKKTAYDFATEALSTYWAYDEATGIETYTEYAKSNATLMSAVDSYLGYDIDALITEVKRLNLLEYIDLVNGISSIERNMDTAKDRVSAAEKVSDFLNKNNGLIDLVLDTNGNGEADYAEYNIIHQRIVREAAYDGNAEQFIRYISRFESAPTLATKERHYGKAKDLVNNNGIDISLITDETTPGRENFADLIAAYAIYLNADSIVYQLVKENNANKIVNCVDRLSGYVTEEDWLANREEMEKYIGILKPIVLDRDSNGDSVYETTYEGVKDAVEYFNNAYAFFYALHQDENVEYISVKLDQVLKTEAYIEKIGYVSQIERYINANDLDYKDERIVNLLNNLDTCKAELLLREEDYGKILAQNAVYFVNIVERMRTAQTYSEQKAFFEEAAVLYYYIDESVEGAARAVEIYDEYKIELDRIAESSVIFIESVAIYKACQTEEEKYAALVECYGNAQFVEMSYEGAKEAMAEYQAAYDAYMGYVNAVNEEVTMTGNAVGSLRTNSGMLTVIAVIVKKIFGV